MMMMKIFMIILNSYKLKRFLHDAAEYEKVAIEVTPYQINIGCILRYGYQVVSIHHTEESHKGSREIKEPHIDFPKETLSEDSVTNEIRQDSKNSSYQYWESEFYCPEDQRMPLRVHEVSSQ